MQLTIKVTPIDADPYQVETNLFTIVALERKFKIKASELAQGIALEHLAFLSYEACKQHEIVVPVVFDDYLKNILKIEVVSSDANPTDEGVTTEP